jgi:hypothetical protein
MAQGSKRLLVLFFRKAPLPKEADPSGGQLFFADLFHVKGICRQPANLR